MQNPQDKILIGEAYYFSKCLTEENVSWRPIEERSLYTDTLSYYTKI